MARAYSGVLGSIGFCLVILRGLLLGLHTNHILTTGLAVFFVFALTGFCIGFIAEKSMRESEENGFQEMTGLNMAVASKNSPSKGR